MFQSHFDPQVILGLIQAGITAATALAVVLVARARQISETIRSASFSAHQLGQDLSN